MTNLGDRYRDQEVLTETAAGTMVQAVRASDGATVLSMVLADRFRTDQAVVGAAADAARSVAATGQPHVAQLAEQGAALDGSPLLVWGPVGPKRLVEVVKHKGGLPLDRIVDIARQIALALAAGEAAGVPHHDLNPRLVTLLDGGDAGQLATVAGFGASKLLPLYSTLRKNEPFHGTPEYMAPEICGSKGSDHRSDIYSLGILMYEMVTVKPPFLSNNINTTIKRQIYEKPLPLHLVKPGVDHVSEFEKVVLRAVEKDPKKRFQTAMDFVAALEALRNECFPNLVFSDAEAVRASARSTAAIPQEQGSYTPASEEDITSRKHGTLVFTGLGHALDLDEEQQPAAFEDAPEAPGKVGTQIFAGLGSLLDDEPEDAETVEEPAAPRAAAEVPVATPPPEEPTAPSDATAIMDRMVFDEPAPVERPVEPVEEEAARRQTMMFDPRAVLSQQAEAAAHTPAEPEPQPEPEPTPPASEPAPNQTMLFEAVREEKPKEPAKVQPDADTASKIAWAAAQPPRDRAKTEEMEAWFDANAAEMAEPEDPYTLAEGKKSTRKFMILMAIVTVVLVVVVAVFLDSGPDARLEKGKPTVPQTSGDLRPQDPSKPAANVDEPVVDEQPEEQPAEQVDSAALQAAKFVELGNLSLERDNPADAKNLYNQALSLDADNAAAKAGLERVAGLEAAAAARLAADVGVASEAVDSAGAVVATDEAAALKAAEEAAAAKAAEEAAAAKAAEEAAAAEGAIAANVAAEAAAAKAAEAAAAKAAEAAAAKAAEEAAARAAEEAAAASAAEAAAAAKAAEAAAAKKAAEAAAAKKAAEAAAVRRDSGESAAKRAEAAAAKKAAAEAAAAKKAEAAAKKKAAAEAAAAKKAATEKSEVANAGTTVKKEAAVSSEDESKRLVKLGIGAMKSGNSSLALKYFNKAKALTPDDKYIQKYIEKASTQ